MKVPSFRWALLWLLGIVVVLGVGIAGFDAAARTVPFDLTVDDARAFATRWAPWTAVGAIALMVLHSFVPLPGEIIAAANGAMFGPLWGTVVTWSGAMVGAGLSFGLSRVLGRPVFHRVVAERYWQAAEQWHGRPALLLLIRLLPMVSFNLINYAAGLSGIRWWTFLWTTGVGVLPITILSVFFGDWLLDASWLGWASLALAFAALAAAGRYFRRFAFPFDSDQTSSQLTAPARSCPSTVGPRSRERES